jgi:23S rRNA pseudouridine2605 synthase
MVGHPPHRKTTGPPGQALDDGGERVAKALARAGVASRRDVERLIAAGRVALNGQMLTTPAIKVSPGDILTVDGAVVDAAEPTRLFRYHKPAGLLATNKDPQGRRTVFDALPPGLPRLISVGRLDLASEGLLLLTNDGELARALELPATGLARRYRARALGRIDQARLDALRDGITIEGVRYGPIEATLDKAREGAAGANVWITVTLTEGKNREVRRVLEAIGLKVNRLIRLAYGPFALSTLEPGMVEEVGPRVIREQLAHLIAPANLPRGDRAQFVAAKHEASGRRTAKPRTGAGVGAGAGAPTKKVYKSGWAKPKIRRKRPSGPSV